MSPSSNDSAGSTTARAPRFAGRTVVITGAASGFGRAAAERFAGEGARIVAIDRDAERLDALVGGLPPCAAESHARLTCDLRPAENVALLVEHIFATAPQVDVLVNSAGVCHFSAIDAIPSEEWDEVFEIDVRALFLLSTAIANRVIPSRGARIINLGSNAGRKGRALSAHYAAAKAAVANLTESLALAYGPKNITVNTVCPAVVLTPLWETSFAELGRLTGKSSADLTASWRAATPLRRLGTVEDVTNLIVFLASDEASFITGQAINVCGGFMLTC
jgi:NAD(P)-dependent dehydrogenase (short-subunit alcohol dehydrogenase family)